MSKSPALEQKELAQKNLIEVAGLNAVGDFIEVLEAGENLATFLFENKQKGYVGWRWSVTVFQADKKDAATISEILLLPGENSLIAPDWVPWSERLADYKALQAELEAQAALDAEDDEAESEDESDGDESGDNYSEIDDSADDDEGEELAATNVEESVEPEGDAKTTGRKPRFSLRRFSKDKSRDKGKKPKA